MCFVFQAEDGIRDAQESRGLGEVYKRQLDDWLKAGQEGQVDEDSKITGRVRVEKGAKVIRSTIRGPAIIGRDAELIDARIGPFTSIGIASKYIVRRWIIRY